MSGKVFPLTGLVSLIILTALSASLDNTYATTFVPAQPGGVVFSALAVGANPDITTSFDIRPPSTNFSTQAGHLVTFGDSDVAIAGDAAIPTGAYIGALTGIWQLGLANEGCNSLVPINFPLVEASTAAAPIAPAGPPSNLLANLAEDDGDLDNVPPVDVAAFAGNGIADGADAYPTFLAASLDPDGPGPAAPIVPVARYFGMDFVANALISIVQVVIMPPGALAAMPNLGWMTGPWGFPMLVFVDNPSGPPSNSAISDFCNFTSSNVLLGVAADNACTPAPGPAACGEVGAGFALKQAVSAGCPGGPAPNECGAALGCPCPRATNPAAAQVLTWRQYSVSYRDADSDGHENPLDPCPLTANPGWDPRDFNVLAGDADGDGLPTACDPADAVFNNDQDGDGWQNRLDNCPLVANVTQADGDIALGVAVPDGGPRSDGIGTACDPAPGGANGHYRATALAYHICIGPPAPACAAAVDADSDGIANVSDNCIAGANPPITFPGPAGADTLSLGEPAGSVVLDVGDTTGFTVGSPIVLGAPLETLRYIVAIDPAPAPTTLTISVPIAAAHPVGAPVAQVMFSQSQRDLDASGFGDSLDLAQVITAFATEGGSPAAPPGYQGRLDLNYDNLIDIEDVSLEAALFGSTC